MCCAIKPMAGWHLNKVATVCRERCGGQGYLAVNRFGEFFGSAHAGMTAEGDNSVLMQKVAKEHMGLFKPHDVEKLSSIDLEDPGHILQLFKLRENELYATLKGKLGKAMLYTKVTCKLCSHKWMFELSSLIYASCVRASSFASLNSNGPSLTA